MGYEHHLYRPRRLQKGPFVEWVADVAQIIAHVEAHGCLVQQFGWSERPDGRREYTMTWEPFPPFKIRGEDGTGAPLLTADEVHLNGDNELPETPEGVWGWDFHQGGASFGVQRYLAKIHWDAGEEGNSAPYDRPRGHGRRFWDWIKTDRRPYDAVVTACLMALECRFPEAVILESDGEYEDWHGGRELIRDALGFEGVGINRKPVASAAA